ncbi:MAG: cyclopropane-fatty-acyl-phospholipid synthase family protein [Jatrophihabitantaceae bacterium]
MTIADLVQLVTDGQPPMRVQAFDGSTIEGTDPRLTLNLRNERALRYLITAPGDLGMARAYVSGDLELIGAHPGDPYPALRALASWQFRRPRIGQLPRLVADVGLARLLPPAPPPQEALPRWRRTVEGLRHSYQRDASAISRHYDVSNEFYQYVLGPSMAYTCAVYAKDNLSLEQAQEEKFDLVARKLALGPGMRLLDVGCGWGGMARHAAQHYGVNVVAVTLSKAQADWAAADIERHSLSAQVRIVHSDYRDAPGAGYDAISSIGLLEHVGVANYDSYFRFLRGKLRDGGRLLNHCITRPDNLGSALPGAFIDRYVFPDGELTGVGTIISQAQNAGLEVRHEENLREHYALTLQAWCANLVTNWDCCISEVGEATARVWGLYMAACRLGFETRNVELHQVVAVKTTADGNATFPLRPAW